MKIVLSRKGFDSSSGGHASPILPDGKMLSLPIPGDMGDIDLSCDIIARLEAKPMQKSLKNWMLEAEIGCEGAHLDPDLAPRTRPRPPDWLPAFGQD